MSVFLVGHHRLAVIATALAMCACRSKEVEEVKCSDPVHVLGREISERDVLNMRAIVQPAVSMAQARQMAAESVLAARHEGVNWGQLSARERWVVYRRWVKQGGRPQAAEIDDPCQEEAKT